MGGTRRNAARRPAVLLALLGVLALAGCGRDGDPPPAPADPLRVGLVANTLAGGLGREQDEVRRLGVRWLREELAWPELEPRRGRFDWRRTDALFAAAAERRMRVLPLLNGTPAWLHRDPTALPPDARAWGRFVAAAVGRYGPRGSFWRARPRLDRTLAPRVFELWNEPYLESSSAGGPDPARFAALARAGLAAGRRADPAVRFLLPAEAAYTRADGTLGDWLADLLRADPALGRLAGGFAVHPYSAGDPGSRRGDPRLRFRRLDDVRATLRARGLAGRPVWITELGWPTCPDLPQCVGEDEQARFLGRAFALVRADYRDMVEAVFVYTLRNHTPVPRDAQRWFGLLRADGTRKPAWHVVRRVAEAAA